MRNASLENALPLKSVLIASNLLTQQALTKSKVTLNFISQSDVNECLHQISRPGAFIQKNRFWVTLCSRLFVVNISSVFVLTTCMCVSSLFIYLCLSHSASLFSVSPCLSLCYFHTVALFPFSPLLTEASGGSSLLNLDFFGPVDESPSSSATSIPGQLRSKVMGLVA